MKSFLGLKRSPLKFFRLLVVLFLVAALLFPDLFSFLTLFPGVPEAKADHWFVPGAGFYKYRKQLTIDAGLIPNTAGSLTNFPVLISYTDTALKTTGNGGKVQNSSGFDIIFTDSTHVPAKLDHQIEQYDPVTGKIVMWARIPSLSATVDTTISIYYGNSSISTSQENVCGGRAGACVWDSDYEAVWLMKDDPAGTAPQLKDSTTNLRDGTSVGGMLSTDLVAGSIGYAIDFRNAQRIDTSNFGGGLAGLTLEAWVVKDTGGDDRIVAKSNSTATNNSSYIWSLNSRTGSTAPANAAQGRVGAGTANGVTTIQGSAISVPSALTHLAFTYDGATMRLYRDGLSDATPITSESGSVSSGAAVVVVGNNDAGTSGQDRYFDGRIEDVRVSKIARSADWISTEYNNQRAAGQGFGVGKFIKTLGAETQNNLSVAAVGTQTASVSSPSANNYAGGTFRIVGTTPGGASNLTSLAISETNALFDAGVLTNVHLRYDLDAIAPYDCADQSFAITDTLFGSASFVAQKATFSNAGVAISDTQAFCGYLVFDVPSSVSGTLEFEITAAADVVDSAESTKTPTVSFPEIMSGSTSVTAPSATLEQSGYRWFANANSLTVGDPLQPQNIAAALATDGIAFRLRLLLHAGGGDLSPGALFKLQVAPRVGGACNTDMATTDEIYGDVSAVAGAVRFYNNGGVGVDDGVAFTNNTGELTHGGEPEPTVQTYEEVNPFTNTLITAGTDGKWDFSLVDSSASSGAVYCFRVVRSDNTLLTSYTVVPEITMSTAYALTGTYTSNDINITPLRAWNVLEWNWELNPACAYPSPCNLRIQIRTAPTQAELGTAAWSGSTGPGTFYQAPALGPTGMNRMRIPIAHNTHPWLRYQVLFDGNGTHTPILNKVKINYQ